ncbi:TPR/glycosyl transferase domain protein [hydrothermal vent metagenome]|uniref:TPR/glycosyl transferase domain protein n=1 Tax=hydrothermal vent metagenome TaxID=652676 RepID=A0A3B1BCP8_9ZZZZ
MKKVLIITYYWPPAGGAGVQRALKFVKYLPQFGWEPIVLTVENPDSPTEDLSLLGDIPKECKVYKTRSFEPFDIYKKFMGKKSDEKIPGDILLQTGNVSLKDKLAKWVRVNLFIPDAKIGWKKYAVKKGVEIIEDENIDLIFTTSPPQTTALIGRKLSKLTGVKWVADFRDPWMEIVYYQNLNRSRITKTIDSSLESKVMNDANTIVTISEDMSRLLKEKAKSQNIVVIPNGFDETDFDPVEFTKNDKFTIAYTGSMSKDRVPYPFINALKKMIYGDGIRNIQMKFAGKFCPEFYEAIKNENLTEFFIIQDFVPHKESTKILQSANALLLVIDNVPNNKGFLTGKLFEYMGCRKPIFAIGPVDGDANRIIKETDCGTMIDYADNEGAYKSLRMMYNSWENDSIDYKFNVEGFSREHLTKKLTEIFEEITE